jgi:hypothetical protein
MSAFDPADRETTLIIGVMVVLEDMRTARQLGDLARFSQNVDRLKRMSDAYDDGSPPGGLALVKAAS